MEKKNFFSKSLTREKQSLSQSSRRLVDLPCGGCGGGAFGALVRDLRGGDGGDDRGPLLPEFSPLLLMEIPSVVSSLVRQMPDALRVVHALR